MRLNERGAGRWRPIRTRASSAGERPGARAHCWPRRVSGGRVLEASVGAGAARLGGQQRSVPAGSVWRRTSRCGSEPAGTEVGRRNRAGPGAGCRWCEGRALPLCARRAGSAAGRGQAAAGGSLSGIARRPSGPCCRGEAARVARGSSGENASYGERGTRQVVVRPGELFGRAPNTRGVMEAAVRGLWGGDTAVRSGAGWLRRSAGTGAVKWLPPGGGGHFNALP